MICSDYIEIKLLSSPHNSPKELRDKNSNLENVWTGTVVDSHVPMIQNNSKVFVAKIFTLNCEGGPRYFAHKNAVIAVE